MKFFLKSIAILLLLKISPATAQKLSTLTVEKIMRDPKIWIGTAPSNISWSADSKMIYFNWNPDKNLSDSLYSYNLADKKIVKVSPSERKKLPSDEGTYNRLHTMKIYVKNGDVFLIDQNFAIRQLTNTVERESNPAFSGDEQSILFERGNNLFSIQLSTGLLTQHTDFKTGTKKSDSKTSEQEKFLKTEQLALFEILKERKEKKKG